MSIVRTVACLAAALALVAGAAEAQLQGGSPPASVAPDVAPQRLAAERKIREALWSATRHRVGLTDPQMNQLGALNRRLEPRRAELMRRERAARRELREQMTAAQPDDRRVATLLDELHRVQRDRVDLIGEEQKQLATFMSPVQRAKYLGLQEQFRRRIEEARRNGEGPPMRPRLRRLQSAP